MSDDYTHASISYRTPIKAAKFSIIDWASATGINDHEETLVNLQDASGYQDAVEGNHAAAGRALRADLMREGWALPHGVDDEDAGTALAEAAEEFAELLRHDAE